MPWYLPRIPRPRCIDDAKSPEERANGVLQPWRRCFRVLRTWHLWLPRYPRRATHMRTVVAQRGLDAFRVQVQLPQDARRMLRSAPSMTSFPSRSPEQSPPEQSPHELRSLLRSAPSTTLSPVMSARLHRWKFNKQQKSANSTPLLPYTQAPSVLM